MQNRVAKHI